MWQLFLSKLGSSMWLEHFCQKRKPIYSWFHKKRKAYFLPKHDLNLPSDAIKCPNIKLHSPFCEVTGSFKCLLLKLLKLQAGVGCKQRKKLCFSKLWPGNGAVTHKKLFNTYRFYAFYEENIKLMLYGWAVSYHIKVKLWFGMDLSCNS